MFPDLAIFADFNWAILLVAVPAVLIVGISKGGFGGGLGMLAVPLLSLMMSPVVAAAIMLPILCAMDLLTIRVWRQHVSWRILGLLVPAAFIGITIGTLSFGTFSEANLRLLMGILALLFVANWVRKTYLTAHTAKASTPPGKIFGGIMGATAGFTSFVAHAGGPPLSFYLLPQGLNKAVFQATTAWFFFAINYIKLVPYYSLDLLNLNNLSTSLILLPLVPVGIWLGVWLHHRVNEKLFFQLCHVFLALTGLKLIYDGLTL